MHTLGPTNIADKHAYFRLLCILSVRQIAQTNLYASLCHVDPVLSLYSKYLELFVLRNTFYILMKIGISYEERESSMPLLIRI